MISNTIILNITTIIRSTFITTIIINFSTINMIIPTFNINITIMIIIVIITITGTITTIIIIFVFYVFLSIILILVIINIDLTKYNFLIFDSISLSSFIGYFLIYINLFLKMYFSLIKFSRIAFFSGIFVTVCFLIILMLQKQTILKKRN